MQEAMHRAAEPPEARHYRFALGQLELDSDDEPLNRRFSEIYPEGATAQGGGNALQRVKCSVRSLEEPSVAAIRFEDPETLDPVEFCRALFPDRNYVPGPAASPGWRTITALERPDEPLIALNGDLALANRRQSWQPFVANLAVNRVLRLQREVQFFHAASARVCSRGMMFVGPKGSGKTTTALTLASRGHPFLGDEIAAICPRDRTMLPFRRAASIRAGVRTERVTKRLHDGAFPAEKFPDGSARVLANVRDLFPAAGAEGARLESVFFLGGFAERARARPFSFGLEHFRLLTPLACSMWGVPTGLRMLQMSRMMKEVRCYHLDPGHPDDTAELLERLAQELPN